MKKTLLIISAVLLTASCEKFIDLSKTGPEKMLVVNGNLVSGDTLHTVSLSWSRFSDVEPVESAHLECYVNGKLAATTDKMEKSDYYAKWRSEIRFKADFKAGDEVRINVDADGSHAEVVSIVPEAPVISSVDTTSFRAKDDHGDLTDYWITGVRLRDVPGENNYYRITMSLESLFTAIDVAPDSGYEEGQTLSTASRDIYFENRYENLLYRNIDISSDDNKYNYYANMYNLFTDASFADGEYTLKLAVDKDLPQNWPDGFWPSDILTPSEHRWMRFKVLSMSRSSYTYMNAYAFDLSDQSDWSIIGEVPYPSNVKGGTGMVSIMTAATYDLPLD